MVSPASEGIIDKAALPRRGQAFFKAAGVADKGLVTLASVAGEGLAIAYDGRLELPADGGPAMLDGRTRFTAEDRAMFWRLPDGAATPGWLRPAWKELSGRSLARRRR